MLKNLEEQCGMWPYTPDHPYRILINEGSGYEKTNALSNLINNQVDIENICLYEKDSCEKKKKS